ncbi:MAG: hypothetical protein SFV81_15760 [Pirellulaceae bacterium]|nr:hypothetical protein [Pirellulaceae bacterium]
MTNAYLCLADRDGLKTVLPETAYSKRELARLMADRKDRLALWTVLNPLEAQVLESLLQHAEYIPAMRYLESNIRYWGRAI